MTDLDSLEDYVEENFDPEEQTPEEWVEEQDWPNPTAPKLAIRFARNISHAPAEPERAEPPRPPRFPVSTVIGSRSITVDKPRIDVRDIKSGRFASFTKTVKRWIRGFLGV